MIIEPTPLSALLLKVAPAIAAYIKQKVAKSLEEGIAKAIKSPVEEAIKRTAQDFVEFPELSSWLRTWCESGDFQRLHTSLQEGDPITQADIVSSLARFVGFINPDAADKTAARILPRFLQYLDGEMLGSPGLVIVDRRNEQRVSAMAEESRIGMLGLQASMTEILQRISVGPADQTSLAKSLSDARFESRLNTAKDLLEAARPSAALVVLRSVEADPALAQTSPRISFRLHGLFGGAFLQLDELPQGTAHLETAACLDPQNAQTRANLSLVRLLQGEPAKGLEMAASARQLEPSNPFIASVYVRALAACGRVDDAQIFVCENVNFHSDPNFLLAGAEILYSQKKFEEVVSLVQQRLENSLPFAALWELLGRAVLVPVQNQLREALPLPWKLPQDHLKTLNNAETAFTKAIDLLERTERKEIASRIRVNRAVVRRLRGRTKEAEADYDAALAYDPNLDQANHAKGLILLDRREEKQAIDHFEAIRDDALKSEAALALGLAHLRLGHPRRALEIFRRERPNCAIDSQRFLSFSELLLKAHLDLGEKLEAERTVQEVQSARPGTPEALCLQAQLEEYHGRQTRAREALEEAYRSSSGNRRDFIAIELADFYFRRGLYNDAATIYEPIASTADDHLLRTRFLLSLYRAGQRRKAFDIAVRVRRNEGVVSGVTEVEVKILESVGDLIQANDLLTLLIERYAHNAGGYRVQLATNLFRQQEWQQCRSVIENIAPSEIDFDPTLLMQVAKLRHWLDMPSSLNFIYEAVERGRAIPDIQLTYLLMTLARAEKDEAILHPSEAGPGCVVTIRNDKEQRSVRLVGPQGSDEPPEVVSLTSPLGKKLIGLRVGDQVDWPEGTIYSIVEIESLFVVVKRQVLAEFEFAFPDHPGLRHIEFSENDLTPILTTLENQHEYAKTALRLYRDKKVSLAGLANLLNQGAIDVWMSLIASDTERLLVADGNEQEVSDELNTLANASEIVADQTGLFTLARLGLLASFADVFDAIYVAQHVLDDIQEMIAREDFGSPVSWIGKVDGHYVVQQVDKMLFKKRHDTLCEIRTFIIERTKIVPCYRVLDYEFENLRRLQEAFSSGSISAILVAAERNLALFVDDLMLRTLARQNWQVKGFWTQPLLLKLSAINRIDQIGYYRAITNLIQAGYYFVRIDVNYLLWLINDHGLQLTPEVISGLSLLEGPDCTVQSAVRVAAETITAVYRSPVAHHFRQLILDAMLSALVSGRSPVIVTQAFVLEIQRRMGINNQAFREISASVRLWQKLYFGVR